jgi:hypothetical protein
LRNILFIILLLFSCASTFAQAGYKNTVKFGAFLGSLNGSYERAVGKRHAFAVAPAYGTFRSMGIRYAIAGAGAEYRFYVPVLKKEAPCGFYAATGAGYYKGNASYSFTNGARSKTDIAGTAIKATAGYQHVFKNRLVLDVSAGTQYVKLKFSGDFFTNDEAFSGFLPYVGVGVGYAF